LVAVENRILLSSSINSELRRDVFIFIFLIEVKNKNLSFVHGR